MASRAPADPRTWPAPLHRLSWWLTRQRVRHAVIGGVATACHVPGRVPRDLDVVLSPRSAAAAERAIARLLADQVVAGVPPTSPAALRDGAELDFATRLGPLHVVGASLPAGIDRADLVARRRWYLIGGRPVPVCALDALIAIKAQVGSPRGREDLPALERARAARER